MTYGVEKALLGKTITKVTVSKNREDIVLETTTGPVKLTTYSECCSHTWIEDLDDPDALLGTVTEVRNLDMPNLGDIDGKHHTGVDSVSYYGLKITTEKGRCTIDFRNDSNGYYGGSLEVVS